MASLRKVDPADLLGGSAARLERQKIQSFSDGKRVLVTGAAGSVGSELARQITGFGPSIVCMIDRAENPLMFLEAENKGGTVMRTYRTATRQSPAADRSQ